MVLAIATIVPYLRLQCIWSNQHFSNAFLSISWIFWHFLIVPLEMNIDRQFPVILCSNIVLANSWSDFINKSIVATEAELSISSCEYFITEVRQFKICECSLVVLWVWINDNLDLEINWVLINDDDCKDLRSRVADISSSLFAYLLFNVYL